MSLQDAWQTCSEGKGQILPINVRFERSLDQGRILQPLADLLHTEGLRSGCKEHCRGMSTVRKGVPGSRFGAGRARTKHPQAGEEGGTFSTQEELREQLSYPLKMSATLSI